MHDERDTRAIALALRIMRQADYRAVVIDSFTIRAMAHADLEVVGRLAAELVAMHHAFDRLRFIQLPDAAKGYAGYLGRELKSARVVLLVAERASDHAVVGYAYGCLEGRDYNALLDAAGKLEDVYVDASVRGQGIGEQLVRALLARLTEKGAPRVVLMTATKNESAQRLFARLGFRTTMQEMTRESEIREGEAPR